MAKWLKLYAIYTFSTKPDQPQFSSVQFGTLLKHMFSEDQV